MDTLPCSYVGVSEGRRGLFTLGGSWQPDWVGWKQGKRSRPVRREDREGGGCSFPQVLVSSSRPSRLLDGYLSTLSKAFSALYLKSLINLMIDHLRRTALNAKEERRFPRGSCHWGPSPDLGTQGLSLQSQVPSTEPKPPNLPGLGTYWE